MRRRRNETGAVAILIALVTCFTIIPLGGLAVDLGVQRVARRDMQAVADVVALDLSRQLNGRAANVIYPSLQGLADDSLQRNSQSQIGHALKVTPVLGTITGSDPAAANYFTALATSSTVKATAVKVTAEEIVNFSLMGGSGHVSRSAVGEASSRTCFTVGSFVAGFNNNPNGLAAALSPLLGNSGLQVGSYQGLAAANLSVADLMKVSPFNVGTPDQVLAAGVTVQQLFTASANALQNDGGSSSTVNLLNSIATSSLNNQAIVHLSDIVNASSGAGSVLDAEINLLELVGGAVAIANGTNFLNLPTTVNIGGLSVTQQLAVIEKAHGNCGVAGAFATSAQVTLTNSVTLAQQIIAGFTLAPVAVAVNASVGQAVATLGTVSCAPPNDVIPITVKTDLTTLAAHAGLSFTANDLGLGQLQNLPGLGGLLGGLLGLLDPTRLVTADVAFSMSLDSNASKPADPGTVLTWSIPGTDSYSTIKSTGSGSFTLPNVATPAAVGLTITDIRIAGVPLGSASIDLFTSAADRDAVSTTVTTAVTNLINTSVTSQLSGVMGTVNGLIGNVNGLLPGILDELGLNFGGADVTVGPEPAVCNQPSLRG